MISNFSHTLNESPIFHSAQSASTRYRDRNPWLDNEFSNMFDIASIRPAGLTNWLVKSSSSAR